MRWVHDLRGTRENRHYFVLPALRATPLQVLAAGGDCADKSRLLSAMLREIGIPATMVVCYHRETRVPTHTVVEARLGPATYMVMDPAYGLNFPKTKDGFFGLMDLRTDPQIVDRHVRGLVARAAKSDPILSYNPISAAYDHATSINWDKNIATRSARFLFSLWMGDEVYRFSRPLILEEPKLFIAAFLTVVAGIVEASAQLASRRNRLSAASAVFSGAQACGR